MAITNDHAWLSTFDGEVSSVLFLFLSALINCCFFQDEEMVSDPGQLLRQVLASHNVRIENREYFP